MSRKRRRSKPAQGQKHQPQAPTPWWRRRPFVWIGGVFTALAIAIATAVGTGVGNHLLSAADPSTAANADTPTGPPVAVDSTTYEEAADDGLILTFPRSLTKQQASTFNSTSASFQDFISKAGSLGGSITSDALIQIILRGNSTQTAIIDGMQIIRHCSSPLTGTILYSPPAAEDNNIELGFNLDSQFPTAQNYKMGKFSGNFFAQHSISLHRGETEVILAHAATQQHDCSFTFQLLVDVAGKRVVEQISNEGKPFTVNASVVEYDKNSGTLSFARYRTVYAGGVANAANDGFVEVNPRTFTGALIPS